MSREKAIMLIIRDYCASRGITPTEFARNSNISKSYISKIMLCKFGNVGISLTFSDLIAKGMNMSLTEFQKLIEQYQNEPNEVNLVNEPIILDITNQIRQLKTEDIKLLHNIMQDINSEKIKSIHKFIKNMD